MQSRLADDGALRVCTPQCLCLRQSCGLAQVCRPGTGATRAAARAAEGPSPRTGLSGAAQAQGRRDRRSRGHRGAVLAVQAWSGCFPGGAIVSLQNTGDPLSLNRSKSTETLKERRPASFELPRKQAILLQIPVRG